MVNNSFIPNSATKGSLWVPSASQKQTSPLEEPPDDMCWVKWKQKSRTDNSHKGDLKKSSDGRLFCEECEP